MKLPSRLLLTGSAVALALSGLLLLFAPEILGTMDADQSVSVRLIVQILGGALFGLAMLDWNSRASMIGGIYGRPIVLANFACFFVAAMSILRTGTKEMLPTGIWIVGGVAALFAIAFGLRIYGSPPEFSSTPKE